MGTTRYSRNVGPGETRIWYVKDPPFGSGLIAVALIAAAGFLFTDSLLLPWLRESGFQILGWVFFVLGLLTLVALLGAALFRLREDYDSVGAWFSALWPLAIMGPFLVSSSILFLKFDFSKGRDSQGALDGLYDLTGAGLMLLILPAIGIALILGVLFASGKRVQFLALSVLLFALALMNTENPALFVGMAQPVILAFAIATFYLVPRIVEGWD